MAGYGSSLSLSRRVTNIIMKHIQMSIIRTTQITITMMIIVVVDEPDAEPKMQSHTMFPDVSSDLKIRKIMKQ